MPGYKSDRTSVNLISLAVGCVLLFNIAVVRRFERSLSQRSLEEMSFRPIQEDIKVGLCAIVKDGERYLDEWVDYNFAIGFHELYIYDNSDDNDLKQWGEQSRQEGRKVHIVHYPEKGVQRFAYDDCTETFGNRSNYLAYFDDDEFLVLKKHHNVAELVHDHLPNGSLAIHWRIFGTSNHTLYSPLPVTKRFQYRLDQTQPKIKSIVRVQDYGYARNPHSFELREGTYQRDTSGATEFSLLKKTLGAESSRLTDDVAVLHHYKYKSEKEYVLKSCVRMAQAGNRWNCGETPPVGNVFDDMAWQFLKSCVPKYAVFDEWADPA